MSRFGVTDATSSRVSRPLSSIVSAVKAATEIGVSCSAVSRRSAVTMISSSCCPCAAGAAPIAAPTAAANDAPMTGAQSECFSHEFPLTWSRFRDGWGFESPRYHRSAYHAFAPQSTRAPRKILWHSGCVAATPQPGAAPCVFTYTAYSDWLAAMNSRLRLGPPNATFAQTSGKRMRPSSVPAAFHTVTPL